MRDLDALMGLPPVAYDASEKVSTRATSISMVRYRGNDYSVPVAYGHHEVQVRGYVDKVVIGCGGGEVSRSVWNTISGCRRAFTETRKTCPSSRRRFTRLSKVRAARTWRRNHAP